MDTADSFLVLREMATAGSGRTILPEFMGEADPRLTRIEDIPGKYQVPIWVACHEELTGVPRLSAVRTYLSAALAVRLGEE